MPGLHSCIFGAVRCQACIVAFAARILREAWHHLNAEVEDLTIEGPTLEVSVGCRDSETSVDPVDQLCQSGVSGAEM